MKATYKAGRPLTEDELNEIAFAPIRKKENETYYYLVGMLAVVWAHVEVCLDLLNVIILHEATTKETQLPSLLGRKIKFLRKHFQNIPELISLRDDALGLFDKVDQLKEVRHDIIHGTAEARLPEGERKIIRNDYRGMKLVERHKIYSLREITVATEAMTDLAGLLIILGRATMKAFKDKKNNTLG